MSRAYATFNAAKHAVRATQTPATRAVTKFSTTAWPASAHGTSSKAIARQSQQAPSPGPTRPLITFMYQPQPSPINCTTFEVTKLMALEDSHPLHIKTVRKLEAFDPSLLHWRVLVPMDVSKKAAIRNWAKRRIKNALMTELKAVGFRADGVRRDLSGVRKAGRIREYSEKAEVEKKSGLGGALLLVLSKDPLRALRFTEQEARDSVRGVLKTVLYKARQAGNVAQPSRQPTPDHRRGVKAGHLSKHKFASGRDTRFRPIWSESMEDVTRQ